MSLKLWGIKQREVANILFFLLNGWFTESINYQGCCRSIFCFVIVDCVALTMFCFARFIYWPTCDIIVIRYKCFILFQRLHCSKWHFLKLNCVHILWKHRQSSLQYCCNINIEAFNQKHGDIDFVTQAVHLWNAVYQMVHQPSSPNKHVAPK